MRLLLILVAALGLAACQPTAQVSLEPITLTSQRAAGPRWLPTPDGQLAISWVDHPADDTTLIRLAIKDARGEWTCATIPASRGVTDAGGEAPPQLAYTGDGQLVAVWMRRAPTEANPFASQLWYATSTDHGRTWNDALRLAETGDSNASAAFPQLLRLGDGTVQAFWLDGRNHLPHSQVFMAKFASGRFQKEAPVGGPACQCCKLQVTTDGERRVWLLYRAMLPNGCRDHVLATSEDGGQTFATPQPIAPEGWKLNACPHNGPTLTFADDELHAAWYTGGAGQGVWFGTLNAGRKPQQLMTGAGPRHLTSATGPDSQVVAWDAAAPGAAVPVASHGSSKMGHRDMGAGGNTVWVQWLRQGQPVAHPQPIGLPGEALLQPALQRDASGHIWLACVRQVNGLRTIQVQRLPT